MKKGDLVIQLPTHTTSKGEGQIGKVISVKGRVVEVRWEAAQPMETSFYDIYTLDSAED